MVTISDPLGTPVPVYNRSGTAIVDVVANGSTYTSIPHVCGVTVAMVSVPGGGNGLVELPGSADIGDIVEVYLVVPGTTSADVKAASGDAITGATGPGGTLPTPGNNGGIRFRKIDTAAWSFIA